MTYDVKTPSEYLEILEKDWRKETLQTLRAIILQQAPDLQETIQYKMLAYGDREKNIFHLNAQKNYVSLYVGDTKKVENYEYLLEGLTIGKGCIRFKKSTVISDTNIEEFIAAVIKRWRNHLDTSC